MPPSPGSTTRSSSTRRPGGSSSTPRGSVTRKTSRGWNAKFPTSGRRFFAGEELRRSGRRTTSGRAVVHETVRACASTAPPGADPSRRSGPPSKDCCSRHRRPLTTSRCSRIRRSTGTTTSRWLRAIYSVPGNLIGQTIMARADRVGGQALRPGSAHKGPPPPGSRRARHTDPEDLPSERTTYALRDIDHLITIGRSHGESIGALRRSRPRSPAALDQDAPGLPAARTGEEVGAREGGAGLCEGARGRGHQRQPHRPHDRAGPPRPRSTTLHRSRMSSRAVSPGTQSEFAATKETGK